MYTSKSCNMITVGKSTCFYRLSQVDTEVAYLAKSRYKSTRLTRPIKRKPENFISMIRPGDE